MDRKEFGKLIAALRTEPIDRYHMAWTRPQFAGEIGISENILTNIETGRRAILYPELLVEMANALKLTSGERREFFFAASGVEEERLYRQIGDPKSVLADMLALMDKIQLPAFLLDPYFDIVAVNSMTLEMYNISAKNFFDPSADPVTRINLLRFLFFPEFSEQKAMFGAAYEKFAINAMLMFRASTLRYRATNYFSRLFNHLYQIEDIKAYLQRKLKNDRCVDNNLFVNLDNPRIGAIRAISSSVTSVTSAGELRLFTLIPMSEDTAKAFASLAHQNNYVFQPLPNWPQKNLRKIK